MKIYHTALCKFISKSTLAILMFLPAGALLSQTADSSARPSARYDGHFIAQLTVFSLECSQTDPFRIGWGLEGDYFLPKGFSFHAAYCPTYFGVSKMDANTLNTDVNKLSLFSWTEAGMRINLWDRKGAEKFKWFEESYRVGNTAYGYERSATYLARKIFAIRGGGFVNRDMVNTDMNGANSPSSTKAQVKTDDGQIYGGNLPAYTTMHMAGAYAGLSFISIITEGKKRFRETYIDLEYAPLIRFDNILQGGKSSSITPNAKGSFLTHAIGWRVGYAVVVTKMPGYTCGFELGDRPGVKSHGLYFGTRMSIAFCK